MNKKLVSLALAATLTACGGDSGSSGGNDKSFTGVLSDSTIQGVQYHASPSGKTGTTNSSGQFSYDSGDQITFTFAGLTLPQVTAKARITPLTLAEEIFSAESTSNINRATLNLAILFQSLDSDGNPDNGIQIVSNVDLPASITGNNLAMLKDTAPAEFADELQNVLPNTLTIPSPIAAMKHFYKYELAGNWKQHSIANSSGVITPYPNENRFVLIDADGHFIRAEYPDVGSEHGLPYLYTGYIEFDADTLTMTTRSNERALRTGASGGSISNEDPPRAFNLLVELSDDKLAFSRFNNSGEIQNTYYYQRIPNEQGQPIGVWAELETSLDDVAGTQRQTNGMLNFGDSIIGAFSIFTNTHWIRINLDRPATIENCEGNGLYVTEYSYDSATKTVTLDSDAIHNSIWMNPDDCNISQPATIELRASTRSTAERKLVLNGDETASTYNLRNLSHEERLGAFSTPISNTPDTPAASLNLTGTWRITETSNGCDASEVNTNTYNVTQNGQNVTLTSNGKSFSGSLNGQKLTWSGNYAEDVGTTNLNTTMTIAANGNSLTGSSNWTWTASVNDFCTGTTSYSGTRQ